MKFIKTCKKCNKCNLCFEKDCEKCPICQGELLELSTPYISKEEDMLFFTVSAFFSPFSMSVLQANDPRMNKFLRYSCAFVFFFLSAFIFFCGTEGLKQTTFLFYPYILTNMALLIGIFHIFWPKYSTFKKIFSVIYGLLVFLIILFSIFDKESRSEVEFLEPDPVESSETINIEKADITSKEITTSEQAISYSEKSLEDNNQSLVMPHFEIVDSKMGSMLKSFAVYYDDRSKENIILAAKCWNKQRGNYNVFVYFVKDKTYKIDNRREETEKVIAFYNGSVNASILYFLNPDGTERESMNIY